jgi:TRAP-type C4-dicarboxylate transport system substrate-binding protein
MLRYRVFLASLGLAAFSLAPVGCGSGSAGAPPRTLQVEGTEVVAPQHDPGLRRFATRAAELSDGNLRVEFAIRRSPHDPGQTGAHEPIDDWTLIRQVARGEVDLAWVSTQAFDRLGLHDFDALDAPLLIDSYAAQRALLRSEIPAHMLAATGRVGVTGLGLLAGGLSRPISVTRPLVRAGDFRGLAWRAVPATGRDAAVRALDGRLNHVLHPWFMLPIGLKAGDIDVLESNLDALFFDLVRQTPKAYVTETIRLWPDMTVLIANRRWLARLTSAQRGWVQQAARDAQAFSATHADQDRAAAADLCATGVRFASSSPSALAALRRAFAPAYAQLERNAATKGYIRAVQRMKATVAPEPRLAVARSCRADHPSPARRGRQIASPVLDGVYRVRLTRADLRARHISGLDVERYSGTETLTLRRGKWLLAQHGAFGRTLASGVYTGSAPRTVWTVLKQGRDALRPPRQSRYSLHYADGELEMIAGPSDLEDAFYSSHPWERIR